MLNIYIKVIYHHPTQYYKANKCIRKLELCIECVIEI